MKRETNEFILHDWLGKLPFQQQALLMTAMRGPDGCPKNNSAKDIVRFLRGVCLKPAAEMNITKNDPNDFMWFAYEMQVNDFFNEDKEVNKFLPPVNVFYNSMAMFWDDHDAYPHHFIMHLLHSAEVVAYEHPSREMREYWQMFYLKGCEAFHMNAERSEQMNQGLNDFQ